MFNLFICEALALLCGILYLSFQLKTPAMLETFGGRRLTHLFKPSGVTP
jgi:hypothetical protein